MASRWRTLVAVAAALAGLGAVHSAYNIRRLPRPTRGEQCAEQVTILVPARNEAERLPATLQSLTSQQGLQDARIVVLDDDSDDATARVADQILVTAAEHAEAHDSEVVPGEVVPGRSGPPVGWLGKPWACVRLADTATARAADVLVFVDADVVLTPDAIAAGVSELRRRNLDLLSPWPRQLAATWLERLVQPLQQWSWATTVPLDLAEQSQLASLSAANGQFLLVDNDAYRRCGGHQLVRGEVLEDIMLARRMRAFGLRTGLADGSQIAQCRMYDGPAEVLAGYRKSLWAAFGSAAEPLPRLAARSLVVNGALLMVHTLPAVAALTSRDRTTRLIGLAGYLAGSIGRAVVAARTGARVLPDAAWHPVSVAAFAGMSADSIRARAAGRATWKGRPVQPTSDAPGHGS